MCGWRLHTVAGPVGSDGKPSCLPCLERRPYAPEQLCRCTLASLCVAVLLLTATAVGSQGCTSIDAPITEKGGVDSTGTVQATLPVDSAPPTASPNPTAGASGLASPTPASIPAFWPAKVGAFARNFKGPVWYPKFRPKGFKVDSLDIVRLDVGTGLVCDIVMLNGEKTLQFTQGSPDARSYAVVSAGKVPWGPETADIMYQDPVDTTSPPMIIYNQGGNFAELQGDLTLAQLKAVAASMSRVK